MFINHLYFIIVNELIFFFDKNKYLINFPSKYELESSNLFSI